MIVVIIALVGILFFWHGRDTAGCWLAGLFILIFLFLAAGATMSGTLRNVNGRLDRYNTSSMQHQMEQSRRNYQMQLNRGQP